MNVYDLIPFVGASLGVIAAVYSIMRIAYLTGKKAGLVTPEAVYDHPISEQEEGRVRQLEAQLQQAQKMEAIGTLAGGIAHDFNNILQAIIGYSQILMMGKDTSDADYNKLEAIKSSAIRASELTKRLLIFGRKVESQLKTVAIKQEVLQVSKMLERIIPKMIDIKLNLADDHKIINADPVQIEQVIMNLAVNARDAMPNGGELVIETKSVILDEDFCKEHPGYTPGDYVLLEVSDTGHGIDKEIQEHIYEPFFTTKKTGKGTGLGLAMVYGIVKSHKGYITFESEVGVGTTFKIYFPVVEQEMVPEQPEEARIPLKGAETILLVDDEMLILEMGKELLEEFGYTVFTAPDAETALELYRVELEKIDLIVLDIVMPGIGGLKCIDRLLEINSRAKIIMMSGYSSEILAETTQAGAKAYLNKPFDLTKVLQLIRQVLDE